MYKVNVDPVEEVLFMRNSTHIHCVEEHDKKSRTPPQSSGGSSLRYFNSTDHY